MKLRVWHIPQVPMKPFIAEVASVEEGVRLM
ncbi:superinfection exclusion protein, partial [Escherichia coli]|nr:superinfection exclusion protein [Escherichia coli]EEQ4438789.1 superinfection exclusion protein [Escherichia coli]EEQ5223479.1 superinfection exclusion protein [Escherichia coli]EER8813141.1 superinfection exclusion protein [Escherichia coli]EET5438192.1 superinfection exclusion protein [Escherichia coli]